MQMSTNTCRQFPILAMIAAALCPSLEVSVAAQDTVDFRYSPPEWQTAICLPDDPQKSLVDKSGELLYHYKGGPGREFGTRIAVEVVSNAVWQTQTLYSPRVPIVQTHRAADGLQIVEEAFAVTDPMPGGPSEKQAGPPRNDLILVRITNTGTAARTLSPRLIVDTTLDYGRLGDTGVVVNGHETISASLKLTGPVEENKSRRAIQLESLAVAPGKSADFFVLYSGGGTIVLSPSTVEQAVAAREHAVAYWEQAPLPCGRIQVPDAGIQALLDSSIRNIWQAREIKNGMTAFQVGPTCYRRLFLVDGAFLLEAATMLGAGEQARNGVAYELSHQRADGRIEVMKFGYGYWKENGIVLWTCVRHAMLTQDKAWLEAQWPKLRRIADFINKLRTDQAADAALEAGLFPRLKHTPLDEGLMPHGMIDGGIGDGVDFSNDYWNLLGLRSFIEAARWLGKTDEAAARQKDYDDFMAVFQKAAKRDLTQDGRGNTYLPILMGEAGKKQLPQRAQWAFCQAVYPGQLFRKEDALVAGNLAMLEATEREGMVFGTGWDAAGLWTYFASFYAHAWLWQGDGRKAAQILYAFANHAAPVLDWREEQSLRGEKFRKVGDMPHNWASAEFIRLTVHLLALDRRDELHLFEGLPVEWTKPGMVTRLNGVATPFGPLDMTVQTDKKGAKATVSVKPLAANCKAIIVHLPGSSTKQIEPQRGGRLTFPVERHRAAN